MLTIRDFPRSASYDPEWMLENSMGPNAVWLTEALTQVMSLKSGMRVLDMGCGRAVSSIFLAKEFDLQVWATDLWITAGSPALCVEGRQYYSSIIMVNTPRPTSGGSNFAPATRPLPDRHPPGPSRWAGYHLGR